jgi:hypothetical protein
MTFVPMLRLYWPKDTPPSMTERKVFHAGNKVIYSKPIINWAARVATNRLVAEMKGMLVREQEAPPSPVKILVIDSRNRPPVNGRTKTLDVPPPATPELEREKTLSPFTTNLDFSNAAAPSRARDIGGNSWSRTQVTGFVTFLELAGASFAFSSLGRPQ